MTWLSFQCPVCAAPQGRGCVQGPRRKNKPKPHDERRQMMSTVHE